MLIADIMRLMWHHYNEYSDCIPVYRDSLITHWGRVTHICVVKLTIIGSDNGLSPGRRQAIIWTNAGILLIGPLGTNFIEILIGIQKFSFKKMHLKVASAKWRPFCLGLSVLIMSLKWPSVSLSTLACHQQNGIMQSTGNQEGARHFSR